MEKGKYLAFRCYKNAGCSYYRMLAHHKWKRKDWQLMSAMGTGWTKRRSAQVRLPCLI